MDKYLLFAASIKINIFALALECMIFNLGTISLVISFALLNYFLYFVLYKRFFKPTCKSEMLKKSHVQSPNQTIQGIQNEKKFRPDPSSIGGF